MSRDSLALRTEMAHERNLILTDDIFLKEWCSLYSPVVKTTMTFKVVIFLFCSKLGLHKKTTCSYLQYI